MEVESIPIRKRSFKQVIPQAVTGLSAGSVVKRTSVDAGIERRQGYQPSCQRGPRRASGRATINGRTNRPSDIKQGFVHSVDYRQLIIGNQAPGLYKVLRSNSQPI